MPAYIDDAYLLFMCLSGDPCVHYIFDLGSRSRLQVEKANLHISVATPYIHFLLLYTYANQRARLLRQPEEAFFLASTKGIDRQKKMQSA